MIILNRLSEVCRITPTRIYTKERLLGLRYPSVVELKSLREKKKKRIQKIEGHPSSPAKKVKKQKTNKKNHLVGYEGFLTLLHHNLTVLFPFLYVPQEVVQALPYDLPLCCWCKDSKLKNFYSYFASGTYFPFSGETALGGPIPKGAHDSNPANQSAPLPPTARVAGMGHQQRSGQWLRSVNLLEAQEKWEAAGEFFLWELLGNSCYHKGTACPRTQEEESKTRSLRKISDDVILTSVS